MTTMIELYGIPNCDTVKRARAWLAGQGTEAHFHDFRKSPPTPEQLRGWSEAVGWERLLNRQGTTWRRLDESARAAVVDAASACALMQAQPSLIKRPLVQWADGSVSVGFDPGQWGARRGG